MTWARGRYDSTGDRPHHMVMQRPSDLSSCVSIAVWPPLLCQLGSFAPQPTLVGPPRALNSGPLLFSRPPLPSDLYLCLLMLVLPQPIFSSNVSNFSKGQKSETYFCIISLWGERGSSFSRVCFLCVKGCICICVRLTGTGP